MYTSCSYTRGGGEGGGGGVGLGLNGGDGGDGGCAGGAGNAGGIGEAGGPVVLVMFEAGMVSCSRRLVDASGGRFSKEAVLEHSLVRGQSAASAMPFIRCKSNEGTVSSNDSVLRLSL